MILNNNSNFNQTFQNDDQTGKTDYTIYSGHPDILGLVWDQLTYADIVGPLDLTEPVFQAPTMPPVVEATTTSVNYADIASDPALSSLDSLDLPTNETIDPAMLAISGGFNSSSSESDDFLQVLFDSPYDLTPPLVNGFGFEFFPVDTSMNMPSYMVPLVTGGGGAGFYPYDAMAGVNATNYTAPVVNVSGYNPHMVHGGASASQGSVYAPRACVSCKASHVACESQRPCNRCIRLNRADTCVDAERKKRGRPAGPSKKKQKLA